MKYLHCQRACRRPRKGRTEHHGKITAMISIHESPSEAEDQTVPGNWEGDIITGADNQTALGALAERMIIYLLLVQLKDNDTESGREAFANAMKQLLGYLRQTMTNCQVKVMAVHRLYSEETKVQVCLAEPNCP